jgi:hypothetical protein
MRRLFNDLRIVGDMSPDERKMLNWISAGLQAVLDGKIQFQYWIDRLHDTYLLLRAYNYDFDSAITRNDPQCDDIVNSARHLYGAIAAKSRIPKLSGDERNLMEGMLIWTKQALDGSRDLFSYFGDIGHDVCGLIGYRYSPTLGKFNGWLPRVLRTSTCVWFD